MSLLTNQSSLNADVALFKSNNCANAQNVSYTLPLIANNGDKQLVFKPSLTNNANSIYLMYVNCSVTGANNCVVTLGASDPNNYTVGNTGVTIKSDLATQYTGTLIFTSQSPATSAFINIQNASGADKIPSITLFTNTTITSIGENVGQVNFVN